MNINGIFGINTFKYGYNNSYRKTDSLSTDIFVKTTPSFKGSKEEKDLSFEAFEAWAINSGYLKKIDASSENAKGGVIGSGFEGTVYKIPDTDDWVIKEYKRSSFIQIHRDCTGVRKIEDIIPEMNIGQTIGCIEIPCGPNYCTLYYIRKKQNGRELGVDPQDFIYKNEHNNERHLKSLKLLAEAPQSTYDDLIENILRIHNAGYEVDCSNPNNFLFDADTSQINFVDINDKRRNELNQIGDVLYAILDTCFYTKVSGTEPQCELTEKSKAYADIILNKFFNSMKNSHQKFNLSEFFEELLNTDLTDGVLGVSTKGEKIERLAEIGLYNR